MFLPGLPELKNDFNTTTAHAQLHYRFMIGLGIGNLFVGPISDSWGVKTFNYRYDHFTLASLGIIFVHNIWLMIILRLLQGITGEARQLFQEPLQVIYIKVMN